MLSKDIAQYIIVPSLKAYNAETCKNASILVYGTGLVETGYACLKQIGNPSNGGIGFFQMEPSDYEFNRTWLYYPENFGILKSLLNVSILPSIPVNPDSMLSNIAFAACMCRIHYLHASEPLPDGANPADYAEYHKKFYNTALGAADVQQNIPFFQRAIDEIGNI